MLEFNAALSTVVEIDEKTRSCETPSDGPKPKGPLASDLLDKMHRYWYAANYLCVGQIYLQDLSLIHIYDFLTGLPNRMLLNDRIEQAIIFACLLYTSRCV